MKKFLIIIALAFSFLNIKAQQEVYVGSEQGTTYYLPTFDLEEYGMTQQIYTASELGQAGNLMYIRFKRQSSGSLTRNLNVYVKHTTKTNFATNTDWVVMTADDLVYSGSVNYGTTGWFQITLSEPFQYNGSDNLVICIDDNSGTFGPYQSYAAYQAQDMAISAHSITQNFDPMNPSSTVGARMPAKNHICLGMIYQQQPVLVMDPSPLDLGDRPRSYWMRPVTARFTNDGMSATITNLNTGNSAVTPSAVTFPYNLDYHDTLSVDFTTSANANVGNLNGNITLTYSGRATKTFPYQGLVYNAACPDVWELAQNVTTFPYSNTPTNLHDNYVLPGSEPDGNDAVYKVVLAQDALLSATVSGANGKVAVYQEGFKGEGGPGKTNNYTAPEIAEPQPFINEWLQYDNGTLENMISGSVSNMVMKAGTYYVAASSTAASFTVNINKNTIPTPIAASQPVPANNATNITNPLHLQWTLGQYTTEYQVLLGTTNPPTTVAVAWTGDLAQDYIAANLTNHTKYYWQVNERNSSGTTNGSVWTFTTHIAEPYDLEASNTTLNQGEDVTLSWQYNSDRAFRGYNIYQNNVKINGNTPISNTSYTVSDLAYNTQGYKFNVTAVYNEGESAYSNDVYVYVGGVSSISGNVYEQDGTTPIANATVTFHGRNLLGEVVDVSCQTNTNGHFESDVEAGSYRVSASKDGYATMTLQNNVNVVFGQPQTLNINMKEAYGAVVGVTAEPNSSGSSVMVSWSGKGDERSFVSYKVYRTLAENTAYTSENTNVIATGISGSSCTDNTWGSAAAGVYKYGVAKCYNGNRTAHNTAYACNVYDGALPEGYISYDITNPTSTATVINANLDLRGGDYYDGYIYAFDGNGTFYQIDYQTGAVVYQNQTSLLMVDCAYDYSSGTMYGTYAGNLYTIDLENGAATEIGNTGLQSLHTLACTLSGRLYGISYIDGVLYTINKTDATITAIGRTGHECLVVQSANFDHNTETLYWAGYDETTHGFLATVDIATAETTVITTNIGEQTSWYIPFDENNYNAPIQGENEGHIVWSDGVDKNMTTTLNVSVSLADGGVPTGADVTLTGEDGNEYTATLNATGTHTFNNFRKGDYRCVVDKAGYISETEDVTIWSAETLSYTLEESLAAPRNLFVSNTGYAMWDNNTTPACNYYYYQGDFVTHPGLGYNGADGSAACSTATSFGKNGRYTHSDGYYLFADDFTCDGPAVINSMEFYAYQKESGTTSTMSGLYIQIYDGYPGGGGNVIWGDLTQNVLSSTGFTGAYRVSELYYGLSSTTNPIMYLDADDLDIRLDAGTYWVVVGFRGNDGLDGPYGVPVSVLGETETGNALWKYWEGWTEDYDGSGVKGITMILSSNKIRENRDAETVTGYEVRLDDVVYGTVTTPYFQFDGDNLVEGQQYTTSVKTNYASGSSSYSYFTWTYSPCEGYESPLSVEAEVESKGIIITWDASNLNDESIVGMMVYRDGTQLTTVPVTGDSFADHDIPAGQHTYCVRAVYGNESTLTYWYSMSCPICDEVGYDDITENNIENIVVYPNPASDKLFIKAEGMCQVTITDILGQTVYNQDVSGDEVVIDASVLKSGVYILTLKTENSDKTVVVTKF